MRDVFYCLLITFLAFCQSALGQCQDCNKHGGATECYKGAQSAHMGDVRIENIYRSYCNLDRTKDLQIHFQDIYTSFQYCKQFNFWDLLPSTRVCQTPSLLEKRLSEYPKAFKMFKSIVETPEMKILYNIFRTNGYELRMVGGPVRDILSGFQPNDIDFTSTATPDQMINMMSDKQNISLIDFPKGYKFGTVIARINDKEQFEITTLHNMIKRTTEGEDYEVVFIKNWKIGSSKRDLTINSMYLDFNGVLYDYFNGETDLRNKVIRFVGDPESRIKERYSRILRYFRFHARFSCGQKHDLNTLKAIKDNLNGLEKTSGKRIWVEMKRILVLNNCSDVINVMLNELRIGKYMGFRPNDPSIKVYQNSEDDFTSDLSEFQKVFSNLVSGVESGIITDWEASTLFASLIIDSDELAKVAERLKLSDTERDSILYIITNRQNLLNWSLNDLRKQLSLSTKPNHLRKDIIECMKYCGLFHQISSISEWTTSDLSDFNFI